MEEKISSIVGLNTEFKVGEVDENVRISTKIGEAFCI